MTAAATFTFSNLPAMRYLCSTLFALAALLTLPAKAQNNYQLLFDTLTDDPPTSLIRAGAAAANGDMILCISSQGQLRLMRLTSAGTVAWDRSYPGAVLANTAPGLLERGDGHIVHATARVDCGCVVLDGNDTAIVNTGITAIGPDGSVDWHTRVTAYVPIDGMSPPPEVWGQSTAMDQDGAVYHLVRYHEPLGFLSRAIVSKVWADGQLAWTQWFSSVVWNTPGSSFPWAITPDGDGGCYITLEETVPYGQVNVLHLGSAAEVVWFKAISYLNTGGFNAGTAALTASDDGVLIGTALMAGTTSYHVLLHMASDGSSCEGDIYRPFVWSGEPPLLAAGPGGTLLFQAGGGIHFVLDEDGEVQGNGVSLIPVISGDQQHRFDEVMVDWDGTTVRGAGSLFSTDQVFGYVTVHPGMWAFGLDTTSGCALQATAIEHYEIPEQILEITDLPVDTFPHMVSVASVPLQPVDHAGWNTFAACDLLNLIPEGVDDHGTRAALTVGNNPSFDGSPVVVSAAVAHRVDLYDARGVKVIAGVRGQAGGRTIVETGGLAGGSYLLVATDANGARLGTAVVMVL